MTETFLFDLTSGRPLESLACAVPRKSFRSRRGQEQNGNRVRASECNLCEVLGGKRNVGRFVEVCLVFLSSNLGERVGVQSLPSMHEATSPMPRATPNSMRQEHVCLPVGLLQQELKGKTPGRKSKQGSV